MDRTRDSVRVSVEFSASDAMQIEAVRTTTGERRDIALR